MTTRAPSVPTHRPEPSHPTSTWWEDRRLRWVVGLALPSAYGVLAGVWTPRGPLTTFEALSAMVLALVTGVAVGVALRSRWAMLLTPVAFVGVFELMRIGLSGATVDGIHLDSAYGLMALSLGRGVHALLAVLPMVLGACLGAALVRRRSQMTGEGGTRAGIGLWSRRAVVAVTGVAVLALAVLLAQPASTAPIVDADGDVVPGSVAELTEVDVGEHDLAIMIRGQSTTSPVLLFLAGGPGGSELGAMRRHSEGLEEDFVVATLDQRGTGRSYDELDPTETLTLDEAVADVVAVTEYLRDRFDEPKVHLVGQSWGPTLGVLAVQERPDLFHAYVGVGQMVSQTATDRIFYEDTLAWAREAGRTDLVATLE